MGKTTKNRRFSHEKRKRHFSGIENFQDNFMVYLGQSNKSNKTKKKKRKRLSGNIRPMDSAVKRKNIRILRFKR